jgi:hypothetical protein
MCHRISYLSQIETPSHWESCVAPASRPTLGQAGGRRYHYCSAWSGAATSRPPML